MSENSTDEAYKMVKEDYDTVNEAAEWFFATRKPRTASEIRGILVKLYLNGIVQGIRLTKEAIKEAIEEAG